MRYCPKLMDLCNSPKNVGSFPKEDPDVGTGLAIDPQCGDTVRLQVKVEVAGGLIQDARFKTFGCGPAIATSSLATEWVKQKTLTEALSIGQADFVRELELPPAKLHCAVLVEEAIRAAVADYRTKQEGRARTATSRAAASNQP